MHQLRKQISNVEHVEATCVASVNIALQLFFRNNCPAIVEFPYCPGFYALTSLVFLHVSLSENPTIVQDASLSSSSLSLPPKNRRVTVVVLYSPVSKIRCQRFV